MAELVRVAVDAMGGDNAPTEIIKGVVEAVHADERVKVFLVGQEDVVKKELAAYSYPAERIEVVHASEVIETGEPPVNAIRGKKNSSIVKGLGLVKNGECDGYAFGGRIINEGTFGGTDFRVTRDKATHNIMSVESSAYGIYIEFKYTA